MQNRSQKRIETINKSKHMVSANSNSLGRSLRGLILLINEYYWKTFTGPFFTFFFPLVIISLLGWMLGYFMILSGSLSIGILSISLTSMPTAIYEFKSSSLLKRIGASPINPKIFITAVCSFYIAVMIISVIWSFLVSTVIFISYWEKAPEWASQMPSVSEMLANINYGGYIYSQILTIVIGASIGIMLVSIARSSVTIQSFGVIILIVSMFLSGQVFPLYIVKNVQPLWILGYVICPFKSTACMIVESWYGKTDFLNNVLGSSIFDLTKSYIIRPTLEVGGIKMMEKMTMVTSLEKIINIFLPFVWDIIFILVASFKFKWSTR